MKKRILNLIKAECLLLRTKLEDVRIWLLKRVVALIMRNIDRLDAVNAYLAEAEPDE